MSSLLVWIFHKAISPYLCKLKVHLSLIQIPLLGVVLTHIVTEHILCQENHFISTILFNHPNYPVK